MKKIVLILSLFAFFVAISSNGHAQSNSKKDLTFEERLQQKADQDTANYQEAKNGTVNEGQQEMFDYSPPSRILWGLFLIVAIYTVLGLTVVTVFRDSPLAFLGQLYGFTTFRLIQDEKIVIEDGYQSQNYDTVCSNGWHTRFWWYKLREVKFFDWTLLKHRETTQYDKEGHEITVEAPGLKWFKITTRAKFGFKLIDPILHITEYGDGGAPSEFYDSIDMTVREAMLALLVPNQMGNQAVFDVNASRRIAPAMTPVFTRKWAHWRNNGGGDVFQLIDDVIAYENRKYRSFDFMLSISEPELHPDTIARLNKMQDLRARGAAVSVMAAELRAAGLDSKDAASVAQKLALPEGTSTTELGINQ